MQHIMLFSINELQQQLFAVIAIGKGESNIDRTSLLLLANLVNKL